MLKEIVIGQARKRRNYMYLLLFICDFIFCLFQFCLITSSLLSVCVQESMKYFNNTDIHTTLSTTVSTKRCVLCMHVTSHTCSSHTYARLTTHVFSLPKSHLTQATNLITFSHNSLHSDRLLFL